MAKKSSTSRRRADQKPAKAQLNAEQGGSVAMPGRAAKARKIGRQLAKLYPSPPIFLHHRDPFTLLIAVLLSAQCTDERVNRVTPGLFELAPDPQTMAQTPESAILAAIRSCGLAPSKAKNIRALSQLLVDRYNGVVPADWTALEALPGVGHKTAGVVLSHAFGQAAFPVDTHIHRLAARWGLSNGTTVEQTERDLKELYPPDEWSLLHRRIILFGREYCPARGHDPAACPICQWAAPEAAPSAGAT